MLVLYLLYIIVSLEANSRWWHGYSDTDIFRENKLLSSLVWNGCRDYSAFLCLPSALRIWSSMPRHNSCAINTTATTTKTIVNKDSYNGIDGVRSYIKSLLKEQICMLMHEWKVDEDDFIAPYYMREHCPMILVSIINMKYENTMYIAILYIFIICIYNTHYHYTYIDI